MRSGSPITNAFRRFAASAAALSCAALLLLNLPGCPALIVAQEAITGGPTIERSFDLFPARMAVVVDDPRKQFTNPALRADVASSFVFHLVDNNAIKGVEQIDSLFVDQREVYRLAERLGDDWSRTSLTQIGRLLDAEVVIHIQIERMHLSTNGAVLQPSAFSSVRVIDAARNRQLFPIQVTEIAQPGQSTGESVSVQSVLLPRGTEVGELGTRAVATRDIAQRIGRDAARLFYDYKPVPAGKRFEEN